MRERGAAWRGALRRSLSPLKAGLLALLGGLLDLRARCTPRQLGLAIVFHRVGETPGNPQLELVPAMASGLFAAHLRMLSRRYRIVPARELAAAAATRTRFQRFPLALTFDDDWSGHTAVTLGMLGRAGVTATFFLNGRSLDAPAPFWFELMQSAYDGGLMGPPQAIHVEAERVQGMPAAQRAQIAAQLAAALDGAGLDPGMRREEVRALALAGHEIGFHTRDHQTLTTLDGASLHEALRTGVRELEEAAGGPIDAIAYPAGKADSAVRAAARSAGFTRGYSTQAEPIAPDGDPLWLGRVYPSHESPALLLLSLAQTILRGSSAQTGKGL